MENDIKVCGITYIYGLFWKDEPDIIRYIGKSNDPHNRLKEHIRRSKLFLSRGGRRLYSYNWIIKVNYDIGIKIIEVCSIDKWQEKEQYYISLYDNLTNTTIGGECGSVTKYEISYDECKKIIEKYNISSISHWKKFIKNGLLPDDIPRAPNRTFKHRGWVSWGDFLGTGNVRNGSNSNYLSYEEAKIVIKEFGYSSINKFKIGVKSGEIPDNITNKPGIYYKKRGWVSWGDFLGTGRVSNKLKEFVSYEECKKFAIDNNIKTVTKWWEITKPDNIPSVPKDHYKNFSWSDLLGVEIISDKERGKKFLTYVESVEHIRKFKFKSLVEYKRYIIDNNIDFLPMKPDVYYKNSGYISSEFFLNKIKFLPFIDSRKIIRSLGLISGKDFKLFLSKNPNLNVVIPKNPDSYYKNEWVSWRDWLGK